MHTRQRRIAGLVRELAQRTIDFDRDVDERLLLPRLVGARHNQESAAKAAQRGLAKALSS